MRMKGSDQGMYRSDGSKKSATGFLGPIKNLVTGGTMTEFSTDMEVDGRSIQIPTMVPTLSAEEISYMQRMEPGKGFDMSDPLARSIVRKARSHAMDRLRSGLSPFFQDKGDRVKKFQEGGLATDLDRAAAEYASATSPFAELQNYLLEQPVFDRDPRTQASGLPTLRSLDRPEYDQEALAQQYQDLITSQREAEEAQKQEREKAIADLRTAIAEQTATAAEAAAGERSALSAALEGRIQEAREAAAAEVADQGTIIGDLKQRIGGLTQDLGGISQTIQEEQDKLSAELRESQAGAVDLIQGRINSLNDELAGVSQAVETETAAQSEALRGEREQIVSDLESRIGTLRDQIENLPLNEIQNQIEGITTQSQNFADTARTERERLESDLRAALEGRATAEDLETLRGEYQATGRLVEEALQTGQKQREGLQERLQALQAAQIDSTQIEQQRAAAITGAVDPIQAQIEKLRGEIPQQIDVDALRKQITEEVLAGMPQPVTNVQAPAVSVGPGPGGMDPLGQGGGYSTLPTTEGAAEMMGARPDYSAALNMSDGMADAMGFIPGGSVEDQIAFANLDPVTNVQRRAVTGQPETPTANQELLDLFAANPATKQFGLTATFDPSTNQYVTDLSGAGFAGQTKRQTPEEFAAQLQTQKTTPVQQKPVGLSAPPRFANMPIGRIGIR